MCVALGGRHQYTKMNLTKIPLKEVNEGHIEDILRFSVSKRPLQHIPGCVTLFSFKY